MNPATVGLVSDRKLAILVVPNCRAGHPIHWRSSRTYRGQRKHQDLRTPDHQRWRTIALSGWKSPFWPGADL